MDRTRTPKHIAVRHKITGITIRGAIGVRCVNFSCLLKSRSERLTCVGRPTYIVL